jgi:predicted anti-sigma-YlaC factor YlaD
MRCDELYHLLNVFWREEDRDIVTSLIAAHIHSCPTCARGLVRLSRRLLTMEDAGCEQCRARFPTYYEATHPAYPLTTMPESEMAGVALHLGRCAACREQYLALERISILEENELD